MAKIILSAAILAELQAQRDLASGAIEPLRADAKTAADLRAQIDQLNAEVNAFMETGDPNDDAGLQAANSKRGKVAVLERRIEQINARNEAAIEKLEERLEPLQAALMAAFSVFMDAQRARVSKAIAPFYLEDGKAEFAANSTDLMTRYFGEMRNLRFGDSTEVTVVGDVERAIEKADAMLAGKDLIDPDAFEIEKRAVAEQLERAREAQRQAELDAEADNEARLELIGKAKTSQEPVETAS
jgi:hypothetical protein